MARHLVKCYFCKKVFDANVEPFVKPTVNRYAHKICAEEAEKRKTKEERDLQELEAYIKKLFSVDSIPPKIKKQIQTFHNENNFTYSGIRKTLYYFFEIKGNSLEKANGGIGITPYIYPEAKKYWQNLSEIYESNKDVKAEDYVSSVEVHIIPPKREPMKHMRKLFTFLDKEEED